MKKSFIIIFILLGLAFAIHAEAAAVITPEAVTQTSQPEQAKEKSFLDPVFNLFAPSKPKDITETAKAAEAEKAEDESLENGFSMPQKLLIMGDIFSAAYCAVSWAGFLQGLDAYNEAYTSVNNTTIENYNMLVASRQSVLDKETTAWVSTGIAAVFLLYTTADLIWLHAVFPLVPGYAYINNTQIITLNYGF